MNYLDALSTIIDRALAGAREDYQAGTDKLVGSVEGLEACRGKSPEDLSALLRDASVRTHEARVCLMRDPQHDFGYWRIRCFEAEVEWVCNCVSVMLMNQGQKTIVPPTARAALSVASIVGVSERSERIPANR